MLCVCLGLLALASATAAEATRRFDVPEGAAAETLKLAAQQGGLEIVFFVETVRDVRTPALHGSFTPHEALDRLVAGTGLAIVANTHDPTLTVRRIELPPNIPPSAKSLSRSSINPPPAVKSKNPLVIFGAWLALALGPAQAATTAPADAAPGSISGRVQNIVTGQFLNNVRLTIRGTHLVAFTDENGTYRFPRVPAGQVVLETFYTGLDQQEIALQVELGASVTRDINLTNTSRYGDAADTVRLDDFVVTGAKDQEGQALSTNEQRFAPNIKNVVSTDAYGDITAGNVAEFMRFLPGISVTYEDAMPISVSVRGFADNLTTVSIDGEQTANAVSTGGSRVFQFKQVSINNTSRIEVTKVPTPANPADSLAGSVNMVSKSAFERSRAQFNYKVYLSANGDALTLGRTPFVDDKNTYKVLPAFDFDYTLPVNKNFGLVITGLKSDQFNNQNLSSYSFAQTGSGTGTQAASASPSTPIVSAYSFIDAPKYVHRDSGSIKADWRVAPHAVLSVGLQATYYRDDNGNYQLTFTTGSNGAPSVTGGVPLTYGPTYTVGATGRGSVAQNGLNHHISGATTAENVRYRFDDGNWRLDANVASSQSRSWRRYFSEGNFNQLLVSMKNPVRVTFENVGATRPGNIRVFDNNNQEIDWHDIANYKLTGADEASAGDIHDNLDSGSANLRKSLSFFGVPSAVQIGGADRLQKRRVRLYAKTYTYNNPDQNPAPFLSTVFAPGRTSYWDWNNVPWASPYRAYDAWAKDPTLFSLTPAQVASSEIQRINNTLDFNERVSSMYAQVESGLFHNRLRVLTGVRWERTDDEGAGPSNEPSNVYLRNADGTFAHDSAGRLIRRPEAGAAGSVEEVHITRAALGTRAKRSYDGYYPSLHLTFNATDNTLLRLAYARTYGRPDLGSVIPNITITDNDPQSATIPGTINVRNPGLKPWTANNYDLSAEYYTKQGGFFTAGAFYKTITDFFGSTTIVATAADLEALDLPDRYVGYNLTTTRNVGDASVAGVELNARQSLEIFGSWGRPFSVFANATKLRLHGDQAASFSGFIPKSANWGFTYSKRPMIFTAKWNYRGLQRLTALSSYGPGAFQYYKARTQLDLNLDYQWSKRVSFFAIARNALNGRTVLLGYGPQTPDYAQQLSVREYGVQISAGVKGTF